MNQFKGNWVVKIEKYEIMLFIEQTWSVTM